jgi:hypothetical protein
VEDGSGGAPVFSQSKSLADVRNNQ